MTRSEINAAVAIKGAIVSISTTVIESQTEERRERRMAFLKEFIFVGLAVLFGVTNALPANRPQGGDHKSDDDCVPAFLVNATEDVRKQFRAIDEQALNWTAKDEAYNALAAQQDAEFQAAYHQYVTEFKTKYEALSADAKSALEAFQAIKTNTSLSEKEKKEQEKAKWEQLSEPVQKSISDMLQLRGHCGDVGEDS